MSEDELPGITMACIIQRITTTADGGWRISFDIPESEAYIIPKLSELRDKICHLALLPSPDQENF